MAGGKGTFLEGGTGPGHTAKAAALSLTCPSPATACFLGFTELQFTRLKFLPTCFGSLGPGNRGQGSPGFLICSWVCIGDAKSLLPSSPGSCKDRVSGGGTTGGKTAQAVMGGHGRHPVFQKSRQLPSVDARLLLSILQILGCEGGQRQTLSLFSVADRTPPQSDKRLISSHESKAKGP